MTEPAPPVHGCTIGGQPAMPILVAEYNQLVARAAEAEAKLTHIRGAAALHRKQLLTTAELYAVIEAAALDEPAPAEPDQLAAVLAAVLGLFPPDLNPDGPATRSRHVPAGLVERWRGILATAAGGAGAEAPATPEP